MVNREKFHTMQQATSYPTNTVEDQNDPALFQNAAQYYDAILIVSFGGPEGMDDVIPFLENVLRGRNVPRERMEEVAHHYALFDGVSPINDQNRALIAALRAELDAGDIHLPIYWGNRNWQPYLTDTIRQMANDGIRRAIAFVTSAYSSYSGCRQYRENIGQAQAQVGEDAPQIDKLRVFYNHPLFIQVNAEHLRAGLDQIPQERRANAQVVFTAHSIPTSMAQNSAYEAQLRETCRLVAEAADVDATKWQLVYQSRSGSPSQPWLEPDILDYLRTLREGGANSATDVVVLPVGFVSDHIEILYDLGTEARDLADEIGLNLVLVPTVGTHPNYIRMIRDLIVERMSAHPNRAYLGERGPNHDVCPVDCCPAPVYRSPAR
jgi:protoporphyrin/coproporphyrin ferrochelatase